MALEPQQLEQQLQRQQQQLEQVRRQMEQQQQQLDRMLDVLERRDQQRTVAVCSVEVRRVNGTATGDVDDAKDRVDRFERRTPQRCFRSIFLV